MDEQRRLLDELMGKTRNEDPQRNTGRNFWDSDVDKFFLAGFSPFQEFRNTKSAVWLPECYKAAFPDKPRLRTLEWEQWSRNEELREQFQALPQHEKDRYGYEYDLMLLLERLVQRCDHRIRAVHEDIRAQNEQVMNSMSSADEQALTDVNKQLDELNQKVKEAEALAEKGGDVGQLRALISQIETKNQDKSEILRRVDLWRQENQRSVCEISGNVILPPGAKHQNIHDHEAGKQFQGWKAARQLLKRLQGQNLKPPGRTSQRKHSPSAQRRARSREGERHRDSGGHEGRRDRDRSRERRGRH